MTYSPTAVLRCITLNMNKDQLQAEIKKISAEISRHNVLYYELANPQISDYEYDRLVEKLRELEAELGDTDHGESPLMQVGSDLGSGAKTIAHKVRMASLDNAYSLEEVAAFISRIDKEFGAQDYCCELKIDVEAVVKKKIAFTRERFEMDKKLK